MIKNLKCRKKIFSFFLLFASLSFPSFSYSSSQFISGNGGHSHFSDLYEIKDASISLTGGFYSDRSLWRTAGRETQIWKMTNLTASLDIGWKNSGFGVVFDFTPISDEIKHKKDNPSYTDYYKNIGTDFLYYGDYPVRESYLYYRSENHYLKVGRQINGHGFDLGRLPYTNRHEAPFGLYLDKDILSGASYTYNTGGLSLSGGVLSGRGRPSSGYNFYQDGQTDPNTKGNNTPVLEAKISYKGYYSSFFDIGYDMFFSYHRNKTGSAPGSIYSGKHNDNRKAFGLSINLESIPLIQELSVFSQLSQYEVGLDEDGVQGDRTPDKAFNIEKLGWFTTVLWRPLESFGIQYTFEEIDRADTKIWKDIADFNPDHPSMSAKQRKSVISLKYSINDQIEISSFYTRYKNDYPSVSNIDPDEGDDKYGVVLSVDI